jgi:hypothetical protein
MQIALLCLVTLAGVNPVSFTSGTVTPRYLPEYDYVSIAGYYFNPSVGVPELPAELKGSSDYYLIHLKGPVYPEMQALIESYGVKLIQYIPFNAYIVKMNAAKKAIIEGISFVNWVGNYEPAYKVSTMFKDHPAEKKMLVILFYDEDIYAVKDKLVRMGAEILEVSVTAYFKILKIGIDQSKLASVAQLPEVYYLEPYVKPVLFNADAEWVTQTWKQQSRRVWNKGIKGRGQVVNTCDTGILVTHNMFRDPAVTIAGFGNFTTHRKIIAYQTWTGSGASFGDDAGGSWHGTHTAGTICGYDDYVSGTSLNDGMPPSAKMYFMDIGASGGGLTIPGDLTNLYTMPYNGNAGGAARVSSHSWGQTSGNGYIAYCQQTDNFMWTNRDMLVCFAAGNDGTLGSNTVHPPGTTKDIITAGATSNATGATLLADFSSRGPCDDTRLKPTVLAPGYFLYSSAGPNNNSYLGMAGTSMATPCIAGNVALVREYFARGFYPTGDSVVGNQWTFIPAAVVKAMLINGASPQMDAYTVPDNNIGWGRVDLDDALYFANDIRKLAVYQETVSTGQYDEWVVSINNQSEPLKITVVWTDYPATAGANPAIINNLDLLVTGPNLAVYHGNQYTGGQSTPGATAYDNRNVEECVRRNVPETGNWTIRVTGTAVPSGTRQPYAVIVSGGIGPISTPCLFIAGSRVQDPAPGNQNGRLDVGETVYLTDTLKNLSALAVTGCTGRLRTSNTYITLLDTIGNFGDIAIGASGNNGGSRFRFTASASTPQGTVVPFTLHLTGGGGYVQDIAFDMTVGFSGLQVVWGPKQIQVYAGDTQFIYGCGYVPSSNRLYVCNAYTRKICYYSGDTIPTYLGYIAAPDSMCTDVKLCTYDNDFWVTSNPANRRIYKISNTGTVLRNFANPAVDYPVGLVWLEPQRLLYLSDRRTATNSPPEYIYRSDTLGTGTQLTIPLTGNVGARCLAREPLGPPDTTILMNYTWFNAAATALDSVCLYELRRSNLAVGNHVNYPGWNVRGIEYDPRDGNYWVTIPQNPGRSIAKILGFYGVVGVNEGSVTPSRNGVMLMPGYPNPFNRNFKITYSIPQRMSVKLSIYDIAGRLVTTLVNRVEDAGIKILTWDGRATDGSTIANGVYFYRLETKEGTFVHKLVFTR